MTVFLGCSVSYEDQGPGSFKPYSNARSQGDHVRSHNLRLKAALLEEWQTVFLLGPKYLALALGFVLF